MNIFETKSKYFHNNNSWFAKGFSNTAITLVIVLIGLVVVYKTIQCTLSGILASKLDKTVIAWLAPDFKYKGLKLVENVNEGEGDYVEFLYTCDMLSNPKLNDGKPIRGNDYYNELNIYVYVEKHSDNSIVIDHVGFDWKNKETNWLHYSISDWAKYLYDPDNNKVVINRGH